MSEEQQQPLGAYNRIISQPNQADQSMMRWTLDLAWETEEVMHALKGEYWKQDQNNPDSGSWETPKDEYGKPLTKPILNEYGINQLYPILRSHLSRNFGTGNMTEIEINKLLLDLANAITMFLIVQKDKIGIESEQLEMVFQTIMNPIEVMLLKSRGGNYQKFISDSSRFVESVQPMNQQQNKPSIWQRLGLRGG